MDEQLHNSVGQIARGQDILSVPLELLNEIEKVFIGKTDVVKLTLACFFAGGHLLLEDIPGVGKTTLAKALARALECTFRRIQFTSDMLPSDIIGTSVFDQHSASFRFERGPVFANLVLADELNRASPRTQSALLESMNELQVTVDNVTHQLPRPFFVIATQNPREIYGTYPLPESQLDRFTMRLNIGYPTKQHEVEVIAGQSSAERLEAIKHVMTTEQVLALQRYVEHLTAQKDIVDYVYRIVETTRNSDLFEYGASPRAGIHLLRCAKAFAMLSGRAYVIPDDVKQVVLPVLVHRLTPKGEKGTEWERSQVQALLADLLQTVEVP